MRFIYFGVFYALFSCSSPAKKQTFYQFQNEQTGKQYQYIHKLSEKSEKSDYKSFSYSAYKTSHYYEDDKSFHNDVSFTYSTRRKNFNHAINASYYYGVRDINVSINETKQTEYLDYNGLNIRYDVSHRFGTENFSLRVLNLQFGISYENGSYFDWRRKQNKVTKDFVNFGKSELTYSYHFVPELNIHLSKDLDFGLLAGYGHYYNDRNHRSSNLIGVMFRYQWLGLSFIRTFMKFRHIIDPNNDTVILLKTQSKLTVSIIL